MTVDKFAISKDTVWKIVVEDLKNGKFACALYHTH
jgi:hypothetical protein